MDVGKAWPGPRPPQPKHLHRPHPLTLTFALGSRAIETATHSSAAPERQLQDEGAAVRRGAGRRRSRGWGGDLEGGPAG